MARKAVLLEQAIVLLLCVTVELWSLRLMFGQ